MGLALRLQLSESRLLLGFCIRRSAELLAKGMLGTPQAGTFTSHLQRRLESESPDKCPSCDSLVSVLMLEASVPVVVYLGMFLIFPFGNSFLKWPSTVVPKCQHPEHRRNEVAHLLVDGIVQKAFRGLSFVFLPEVMPVFTNSLANSGSQGDQTTLTTPAVRTHSRLEGYTLDTQPESLDYVTPIYSCSPIS